MRILIALLFWGCFIVVVPLLVSVLGGMVGDGFGWDDGWLVCVRHGDFVVVVVVVVVLDVCFV